MDGVTVPFRIGFSEKGSQVQGWFFNGDQKIVSTRGERHQDHLLLRFEQYAASLDATWKNGRWEGIYSRAAHDPVPFQATPISNEKRPTYQGPPLNGNWTVPTGKQKGEAAWHLMVQQSGPNISAVILRIDGDTGTLTGQYDGEKFVLGHFSGARPIRLEIKPNSNGTLSLLQNDKTSFTAVRSQQATAQGLPKPDDPFHHTTVRNSSEAFRFSAPDLNGKTVSNQDSRFQGKVVIVAVGGSWCPNCHDEAPYLENLYRQYHSKGLEVVALSFEEGDQLRNPTRLHAFVKEYGITYTVLLAGDPEEVHQKIPQAENLDSWPTTFFLGRDGRVRAVHTGFAGLVTGKFNTTQAEDVDQLVKNLLSEKTTTRLQ